MTRHICHVCERGPAAGVTLLRQNRTGRPGVWACIDHFLRTKCAIDGCRHTRDRGKVGTEWICAVHWRRHCPPRSRRRRAYLAFFRCAKKLATPANPRGWDDELSRKYWRFWDTLVAVANKAEAGGTIDMTEINRLFGWEE